TVVLLQSGFMGSLHSLLGQTILAGGERLNAFREVKPVELPNCNLVKGVGMYVRREGVSFELLV
uniref:Uncharacterized protein n=1 Tax=Spermophilus dauricus TaxID=99837 RepID=A0A8C9Q2F6_SPEDA